VDVASKFPEECRYVLEVFRDVYYNDAVARQQEMSPEERLAFHRAKSGPRMEAPRQWMAEQLDEKKVEPNSGLGEAILYTQKRWDRLTRFLEVPGVPLDNNAAERILKKAILSRNYVHHQIMFSMERTARALHSQRRQSQGLLLWVGVHNHRLRCTLGLKMVRSLLASTPKGASQSFPARSETRNCALCQKQPASLPYWTNCSSRSGTAATPEPQSRSTQRRSFISRSGTDGKGAPQTTSTGDL
jgi:hypothetical protein